MNSWAVTYQRPRATCLPPLDCFDKNGPPDPVGCLILSSPLLSLFECTFLL